MDYYPISLSLTNKQVVVVGGGKIAERKIIGLMEAGATITVISPEITNPLFDLFQSGKIIWKKRQFTEDDFINAFLIIAATNKKAVNLHVKEVASPNQLICLIDNPEESNFIFPSVINRGKLHIAVSTSGASPLLAKKIKQEISEKYGEEYKEYVDFLFSCRKKIVKDVLDKEKKQKLLSAITDPSFLTSTDRQRDFEKLMKQINTEN